MLLNRVFRSCPERLQSFFTNGDSYRRYKVRVFGKVTKEMLDKYNIEYESIPGEVSGYDKIVDIVLSKWVKQNLKEELGK